MGLKLLLVCPDAPGANIGTYKQKAKNTLCAVHLVFLNRKCSFQPPPASRLAGRITEYKKMYQDIGEQNLNDQI